MIYLLIILFPISMAATTFLLRKQALLVLIVAVGVVLAQALLVAQVPPETSIRLFGVVLGLNMLTRLFLFVFLSVIAIAFIAAVHLPHGENFVPVTLLLLSLISAILLLRDPFIVSLLLVGSALAAVLAILDLPTGSGVLLETRAIATGLKYLVLMTLAGALSYFSFVLADIYQPGVSLDSIQQARFILALLTAGFALRLALIPFHSWLPDLVEDAAPMVSAIVIAVLNTTSLLVLVLSFQRFPVLLVDNTLGLFFLRIGSIVTVVLAGLLALGQQSIRRTLSYLLIYGSGMVFYGLVSTSVLGLTGAVFESLNQVLAVMLIFVSLGLIERPDGRPPVPGFERRDLLRRWPVGSVGFLCGVLMLLGVPPFGGFASRLLLYQAAAQQNWAELLLLLAGTTLAGLALMRLARDKFLGPSEDTPEHEPALLGETELDRPAVRRLAPEPRGTATLALLLLLTSLGVGLYPQPFLDLINEVVRGLTFVQVL
jgi:formate hydrogenlyase subunit 3/multisubunit Na+/H+ antiporter MnhD subunit